ncbi:MAG TPA: 16S rRNA (uracil(1498)-N(3))-methyltransferase [Burkholderiales bacterium]|nr:16S rRNA (uracil(1498)-N(3))-methyltransferase [Burkholderiales bacterium]
MRVARFFVDPPLEAGAQVALPERAAHHATRVLRLRVGDRLTLFDGRGGEYAATLVARTRDGVSVQIGAWHEVERESPLGIVLAQGISSAERMDLTVQKAVELGVAAIQPLDCEKSVVRLDARRAASRLVHWRRIVISACEQCGRNRLPEVRPPLSVAALCAVQTRGPKWLLSPEAPTRLREAARGLGSGLLIAAGPEAGFSELESRALLEAGYAPVRLGPRILRTETAALAALAVLNAIAGDG